MRVHRATQNDARFKAQELLIFGILIFWTTVIQVNETAKTKSDLEDYCNKFQFKSEMFFQAICVCVCVSTGD